MESLILCMNEVLKNWKNQYDIFSAISGDFSNLQDTICFDNFPLCQSSLDLELISANFDAESIDFLFNRNRSIQLIIEWPEDQEPVVSSVAFVHHLHKTEATISSANEV